MGDRTDCWRIVVLLCLNIGIVTSFRYEIPTDRLRNTEPSFSFVTSSSNNDRSEFSSFSGPKHTSFEDSEPWDSNSAVASPANSQEPVVPVQSESRVFQDRQLFPPEEHAYRWNSQDRQPQSYANDWSSQRPGSNEESGLKSPKTIHIPPLPTLDVIEDPGYDHNRPKWPISEYLADKVNSFYRPNHFDQKKNNTKNHHPSHVLSNNANYEWQQLRPSNQIPQIDSKPSGSRHSYDATKYFHLDEDEPPKASHETNGYRLRNNYNLYGFGNGPYDNVREHNSLSNGHHLASVSTTVVDPKGSATVLPAESPKRGHETHGGGYVSGPHGKVPYFPPDYYPKKRFRLAIHPGYIAAPVAGLAAFGVASALAKKPIMLELGLVNNKYHYPHGHQHHGQHHYPGQGWPSNQVPVYPGGGYPIGHKPHGDLSNVPAFPNPQYPILKPEESHYHVSTTQLDAHKHHHYHHHAGNSGHTYYNRLPHSTLHGSYSVNDHQHGQDTRFHPHIAAKKPWWNPFASLTPRN